jgi:hypothetical protein
VWRTVVEYAPYPADLTNRGETFTVPRDPCNDEDWRNLLTRVYLLAAYT